MPSWRLTGAATLAACTLFACGGAMGDAGSDAASVDAGGDAIDMPNDGDSDESSAKPYSANVFAEVTIYDMAMGGGTSYNISATTGFTTGPYYPPIPCGGAPMDRGCCYDGPVPSVYGYAHDGGWVDMGEMTVGPFGDAGTDRMTPNAFGYYYESGHSWPPGEALTVAATGHGIHPFMGTLQTVALFKDILPRIDMPVTINRSVDFTISWTAEGLRGEVVRLAISTTAGGSFNCFINDSVGSITVPSVLLGQLYPSQGGAELQRFISRTPTVGSDNADVHLIGSVTVSALVTVK